MRRHLTYTTVIIAQAVWICGVPTNSPAADPALKAGAQEQPLMAARANNEFACDLYRKAAVREGNLFFSPISISSVLGMLESGAKGETKKEIRTVLHLSEANQKQPDETSLFCLLDNSGDGYRLKSASRIWGRTGLKINPDFREAIQSHFAADFEEVDFTEPNAAVEKINDWVDDKTNGKISKMLAGPLKDDVQLVAANAIYFKGNWTHRFDPKATTSQKFFARGQKQMEVPTMALTNNFRYWDSRTLLKVIELPYEGDVFSAVLLLPTNRDGMPELEKQLTGDNLHKWLSNLDDSVNAKTKEPPEVIVRLPKFNMSAEMQLNDVLQQLGIKTAFGPRADLSGIAGEPMYVSAVIHKAFVQFDEKGTVATAATVGVASSSIPPSFVADHPFLILIRDRKSGAILFLGRVENPGEEAVASR
ncbi:MAG: serpin family protein [Pirellulaceae bacterium]